MPCGADAQEALVGVVVGEAGGYECGVVDDDGLKLVADGGEMYGAGALECCTHGADAVADEGHDAALGGEQDAVGGADYAAAGGYVAAYGCDAGDAAFVADAQGPYAFGGEGVQRILSELPLAEGFGGGGEGVDGAVAYCVDVGAVELEGVADAAAVDL